MKNKLIFLVLLVALIFGCNKEDAVEPSADFTTGLQNNTLQKEESFTVYLNNVNGEFLVYFKGDKEESTYNPTDGTRLGIPISNEVDSVVVSAYNNPGQYIFTLVASSSGNWANDYLQNVKSITVTVKE